MSDDEPTVPCKTCGSATRHTGTERCDNCWETETRLADYLRRGGANAKKFVTALLKTVHTPTDVSCDDGAKVWTTKTASGSRSSP